MRCAAPFPSGEQRRGMCWRLGIGALRTGSWGHTYAGKRPDLGADEEVGIGWRLDPDAGTAADSAGLGLTVPLRPSWVSWATLAPSLVSTPRCRRDASGETSIAVS